MARSPVDLENARAAGSDGGAGTGNVERLRAAYVAWSARDLDTFAETFAEDVELRPFLGRGLGASSYRGHAGLRRWYEEANEVWDELVVEPQEFREIGKYVVVFVRAVGRGHGSHVQVEAEITHVAEFRDGKVIVLRGFSDRKKALESIRAEE